VVLVANPRGSTSYGCAFAEKTAHDFPSHDYDDLMSVVDAAVMVGGADPNRLFVTGGSAGGLLTTWIVGKTNCLRAAVAVKPEIDLTSNMLTSDQYFATRYLFGRYPWQDHSTFWSHSPLSLVGQVETPTLLMVVKRIGGRPQVRLWSSTTHSNCEKFQRRSSWYLGPATKASRRALRKTPRRLKSH
jgi:dipeptidyl aminopeptidase/acylaminoacyl peptidase